MELYALKPNSKEHVFSLLHQTHTELYRLKCFSTCCVIVMFVRLSTALWPAAESCLFCFRLTRVGFFFASVAHLSKWRLSGATCSQTKVVSAFPSLWKWLHTGLSWLLTSLSFVQNHLRQCWKLTLAWYEAVCFSFFFSFCRTVFCFSLG